MKRAIAVVGIVAATIAMGPVAAAHAASADEAQHSLGDGVTDFVGDIICSLGLCPTPDEPTPAPSPIPTPPLPTPPPLPPTPPEPSPDPTDEPASPPTSEPQQPAPVPAPQGPEPDPTVTDGPSTRPTGGLRPAGEAPNSVTPDAEAVAADDGTPASGIDDGRVIPQVTSRGPDAIRDSGRVLADYENGSVGSLGILIAAIAAGTATAIALGAWAYRNLASERPSRRRH